jgi:imidazolonepropionase-like amidohydrolase
MTAYRAAWVVPIDQPPIRDGAVRVSGGRIVAVGPDEFKNDVLIDMGNVVILPGLVNAHTHLEL